MTINFIWQLIRGSSQNLLFERSGKTVKFLPLPLGQSCASNNGDSTCSLGIDRFLLSSTQLLCSVAISSVLLSRPTSTFSQSYCEYHIYGTVFAVFWMPGERIGGWIVLVSVIAAHLTIIRKNCTGGKREVSQLLKQQIFIEAFGCFECTRRSRTIV